MLSESACVQEISSQEKSLWGRNRVWPEGGFCSLQKIQGLKGEINVVDMLKGNRTL